MSLQSTAGSSFGYGFLEKEECVGLYEETYTDLGFQPEAGDCLATYAEVIEREGVRISYVGYALVRDQQIVASSVLSAADDSTVIERNTSLGTKVPEQPLLVFDVVEVPGLGKVEMLSGMVDIYTDRGWVSAKEGQTLEPNTKLHILAESALTIRFSDTKSIEFSVAPSPRWIELRVN